MITTVADLLQRFLLKEQQHLKRENIRHPTIIGDMYEGLTKTMLDLTIPEPLNLKVVSGIIENGEIQSKQIDCMLVQGDGKQIPHTGDYVYHVHDVLAVIEVKKNLYSGELSDGYANLRSVAEIATPKSLSDGAFRLFTDSFEHITHMPLPAHENLTLCPFHIQYLYHTLLMDTIRPIRILFAYNGFSTEDRLRSSFLKFIESKQRTHGFGPGTFPDLVICNGLSLVKQNGMPYLMPLVQDLWLFYSSYSGNPLILLLELIWTRLSYFYEGGASLFGDDMLVETLKPLLATKCVKKGDVIGWEMYEIPISQRQSHVSTTMQAWHPRFVTMAEFAVFAVLFEEGFINVTDPDFVQHVSSEGLAVDEFIETLVQTNMILFDGKTLSLATREAKGFMLPDGSFVVGEDKSGQMTRWVDSFLGEWMNTH